MYVLTLLSWYRKQIDLSLLCCCTLQWQRLLLGRRIQAEYSVSEWQYPCITAWTRHRRPHHTCRTCLSSITWPNSITTRLISSRHNTTWTHSDTIHISNKTLPSSGKKLPRECQSGYLNVRFRKQSLDDVDHSQQSTPLTPHTPQPFHSFSNFPHSSGGFSSQNWIGSFFR